MFVITKKWLSENTTKNGVYTKEQLSVLGVSWPPASGWKKVVTGKEIAIAEKQLFESLSKGNRINYFSKVLGLVKHLETTEKLELIEYLKSTIKPK